MANVVPILSSLLFAASSHDAGRWLRIAAVSEVTQILDVMGDGDAAMASRLLSLVYDELRTLAGGRLWDEWESLRHLFGSRELEYHWYVLSKGPEAS